MSLSVQFLARAEQDLFAARGWYEAERPGLGDRFSDVVIATAEEAARWPNAGSPVVRDRSGNVVDRAIRTAGFPYIIRYRVQDDELVVTAVYHERRHPDYGRDR